MTDKVLIWDGEDKHANEILSHLQTQVKYPWAFRKLRSARFHLIERRTHSVDYTLECRPVSNGEAYTRESANYTRATRREDR